MATSSKPKVTLPRPEASAAKCRRLTEDLQSVVRAESTVSSLCRCVEELIYNSLDAGSTDILIKVDFSNFHVMVQDNGKGMSAADMEVLGKRYATSKLRKIEDLAKPDRGGVIGYKGESLASIIDLSDCVTFISKRQQDQYSCKKRFVKGRPEKSEPKDDKFTSHGFVVNVRNFLSAQPVRQRRFNVSIQQEGIKAFIQTMSYILPNVHISVWDMETNAYVAKLSKTDDPSKEFFKLCCQRSAVSADIEITSLEPNINGYRLQIMYCTQGSKTKQAQFLYVNSQPISCSKWAKAFNDMLGGKLGLLPKSGELSKQKTSLHAMFVVNIVCALDEYALVLEENRFKVDFVNPKNLEFAIQVGSMMMENAASLTETQKGGKRKSADEERESCKSKMTSTEVVKEIKSNAALSNMRGALVSKSVNRLNDNPLPKPSTTTKIREVTVVKDSSSSASSIEMFPESPHQQNIVEPRVGVLKPISSYATSSRFLPKKGPFGKQCERTIDAAAGFRKRKKQRDSLDPNCDPKKTKVQPDGVQLWNEAIHKARQTQESGSGSDEFLQTMDVAARDNHGDSEGESVISHSLSRLSVTPVANPGPTKRAEDKINTPGSTSIEILKEFNNAAYNMVNKERIPSYRNYLKKRMSDHVQKRQPTAYMHPAERSSLPTGSHSRPYIAPEAAVEQHEGYIQSRGSLHLSQSSQGYANLNSISVAQQWVDSNFQEGSLSQQSRMSQSSPPPVELNFQSIGVRQRDPILRARNQDSRHKRNAVHFDSNTDFVTMLENNTAQGLLPSSQELQHGISLSQPTDFFPGEQREQDFLMNFNAVRNEANDGLFGRDGFSQPLLGRNSSLGFNHHTPLFNLEGTSLEELHPAENLRATTAEQPGTPVSPLLAYYLNEENPLNSRIPESPYFDMAKCDIAKPISSSGSLLSTVAVDEVSSNMFAPNKSTSRAGDFEIASVTKEKTSSAPLHYRSSSFVGETGFSGSDREIPLMDEMERNQTEELPQMTTTAGIEANPFMQPPIDSRLQFRNQWLRATFPGTSSSYWTSEEPKTTSDNPSGDLQRVVTNPDSLLADTLTACLSRIHDSEPQSKWREGCAAMNFPVLPKDPNGIRKVELRSQIRTRGNSVGWSFTKEDIKNASIIGTLDNKFIVAKIKMKYGEDSLSFGQECTLIVVFDQHAVHERIRLETLIANLYEDVIRGKQLKRVKSTEVIPHLQMEFPAPFVDQLMKFQAECYKFGVVLNKMEDEIIKISEVPNCFLNRIANKSLYDAFCRDFLSPLLAEIVGTLLDMQGASISSLPKTILNELKLQACRGAVKFGDKVDLSTAADMISDLRMCNMPFQCAHGRPTVYPLYELRPED